MEIDMPRLVPLACASGFLLAAAAPALAEEPRSEVVSYADLDLDDTYDANRLIERIQRAAGRVCGARVGVQPIAQWNADRECLTETTEWTIRDFGHPVVLAEYYGVQPRVIVEEGSADPYDDDYVVVQKK
jgi:UrcA family protein